MYLVSTNIPYITLLELHIAIDEENEEEINKSIEENLKYEQNKFETYKLLCEYYYNSEQYELAIKYHKLIRPLIVSTSFIDEKIAICYLCMDKYDEGIAYLKENPLEEEAHQNYMLGELYFYKWGKENFKQAAHHYELALTSAANKEKVLKCLGDTYFELVDTTNLKRIVDELRKTSKHGYVDYLEASYYRLTQRFDEAENLLKYMKEPLVPKFRINTIIDNCATKPEILDNQHNEAFTKDDKYSLRDSLKFLMFGEHGNEISLEKAQAYVDKLENMDDLTTCAYSTLSNFYLFKNDYDKAYSLAKTGYDKYLKGEEGCQCCAAFVAYCKLKGIGTEKNIEEAYEICKDVEIRELGDVNENAGHVYAECAILLDKDLNHIYNLLEKTLFRRYSPSRYFMLVKIGKLLNKDTSKYTKLLQESLKHTSKRELEYYSKEQSEFLLNNY
jgi:TPR repeat protein